MVDAIDFRNGLVGSTTVASALSRSAENAPQSSPYGWISLVTPAFRRFFAASLDSVQCQEETRELP